MQSHARTLANLEIPYLLPSGLKGVFMDNRQITPTRLGLGANEITLAHFTPESVTEFLHHVADIVSNKIATNGGASPWFPNSTKDLPGTMMIPSDDGGEHYTFGLFTHKALTRCITAADPANLIDLADLLHLIADSDNNTQRLIGLRIAARWNYAMFLRAEKVLKYRSNEVELPQLPDGITDDPNGVITPPEQLQRNHVIVANGKIYLENLTDGHRQPADTH